jgi:hypothetical protein
MTHEEQFEKISEKFGSVFNSSPQDIENKLVEIKNRKTELVEAATTQPKELIALKDQRYLSEELYSLISDTKEIMTILKESIKQGTRATLFEAYSKLANSVTEQLKELRELNKVIADIEMFKIAPTQQAQVAINVTMSGTDMLEKLLEARKNAEINSIEVDFEVEEDSKLTV